MTQILCGFVVLHLLSTVYVCARNDKNNYAYDVKYVTTYTD